MPTRASIRRQQDQINVSDNGYITDEKTGLILPYGMRGHLDNKSKIGGLIAQRLSELGLYNNFDPAAGYYSWGYSLDREEGTLIPKYNRKGSIASELMLAAIADGEISNVGISPVVFGLLNGVLQSQIAKSKSVTLNITGRETPVLRATGNLSRFNDSPLGFSDSLAKIIYGYRVFNRGQPISTVPIHYAHDKWEDWGMEALPIGEDTDQYYLSVDWQKIGGNSIPFLPDPLNCMPTNNNNWPYWYSTEINGKGARVLLHKSHIIPITPGASLFSGYGTSSLWICLSFLTEHFLVLEYRAETKLNKLTSGLLGISGIEQDADEIRAEMELAKEEQEKEGRFFGSEYTIFASDEKTINFAFLPLRQGDDLDNKQRKEEYEDILSLAFGEPLSAIAMRGGMGLGSRMSETASDEAADSGVYAVFNAIEQALETIYTSVEIAINLPNNRAKRLQIEAFSTFANGLQKLPDGTLSRDEIRQIITRDLIQIPKVDSETVSTTDGNDPVSESENGLEQFTYTVIKRFEPFIPDGADDPIPTGEAEAESVNDSRFDENFSDYEGMLSADNWDSEDLPPQEDLAWYWYLALFEFLRNRSNGSLQTVPRDETLIIRDDMSLIAIGDSRLLASDLSLGLITIQEWTRALQAIVQQDYTHAFLLGKGGRSQLEDSDLTWLNGVINERFSEIEDLAANISQGLYSEAQIANFSANIVSSVTTYEAANATLYGLALDQLPAYPGDNNQICRGRCRCRWFFVLGENNLVSCYWELDPLAQHCASCLENNNNWYPLEIVI